MSWNQGNYIIKSEEVKVKGKVRRKVVIIPPVTHYSSYPSFTLHNYYPNPPSPQNFAHISSPPLLLSPVLYQSMPLPSASQSRVPKIRGAPPPFSIQPLNSNNVPPSSPFVQYMSPLLSPLRFPQPFPAPVINNINSPLTQPIQDTPTPHNSVLFLPHAEPTLHTAQNIQPNNQPLFLNSPATTAPPNVSPIPPVSLFACSSALLNRYSPTSSENSHSSSYTKAFLKITLPSTKDITLLTGCYDFDTKQVLTVKYFKWFSVQVLDSKTAQNAYC
jgi:hypothetical protein